MLRRMSIVLLVALFCFGAGSSAGAAEVDPSSIKGLDAKGLVKLITGAKNKIVVVNVFASWCPPCRKEVPGLVEVRKAFPESEVLIVGVSVDKTPKALYNFLDGMNVNYPIYIAENKFEENVGVTAVPLLLIYDKRGELVTTHEGYVAKDDLIAAIKKVSSRPNP